MKKWVRWDGSKRTREYIDPEKDEIYHYREYTSWAGYSHSETNDLITNLKMGVNPENPARLNYRERAIRTFGNELRSFLENIQMDVWVTPIPPSQSPDDPNYDDRIDRVVQIACKNLPFLHQVNVIYTGETRGRLHHGYERNPRTLAKTYVWRDFDLSKFDFLLLIDDVLTHGTNFRAMKDSILNRFSHLHIVGIFWAAALYEL